MSYEGADLLAGQARINNDFSKEAMKSTNPATYLAIQAVTDIMIPSHSELQLRDDRLMEAFTFARSARTLGTGGRSHNHTGTVGSELEINPSLSTLDDTFKISLKQLMEQDGTTKLSLSY